LRKFLVLSLFLLVLGSVAVAGAAVYGLYRYGRSLPDYQRLAEYEPPTVTRIHAGDGRLMDEYAVEKRVFVPVEAMPRLLIKAFLAAEDKNFYQHPGVDIPSVIRASIQNLRNYGSDRRLIGASTITQQVAKNFLLTNEVSFERKIKEALLAFRMERVLSKDRILELYLNEIYLGQGAYGVAAAALYYFNKSLDELDVAEMAYLAALPKAPNNYHPVRNHEAAVARRNWVISRMADEHFITQDQAQTAMDEPLAIRRRDRAEVVTAEYFAEEVRREIADRYGENALYQGGLSVRTTLDPELQTIADSALRAGLEAYDRRHGWRGPLAHVTADVDWQTQLQGIETPPLIESWQVAMVMDVTAREAAIGFADGSRGTIPFDGLSWGRKWLKDQHFGGAVKRATEVLKVGDIVAVEPMEAEDGEDPPPADSYALRQIPAVNGAIVAIDPHTGRVLAMSGGFSYEESEFNRATQAERQPGSAFKPFVYLTALEKGFTPATLVMDAPFVIDQGPGLGLWRPQNYSHDFYGPATLRTGIEKSRNVMTVRLAATIGMDSIVDTAARFGIGKIQPQLSMALGAGETTLMKLTSAYAMLVNGGKRVEPALIERIQDRNGKTLYRRDQRDCEECRGPDVDPAAGVPKLRDMRERVTDPASAFQMVWIMKGVVERGTARRLSALNRPLAGKTGTTNDSFDTWFIGYSPDLVVGVFVGFDDPKTLGARETGSNVAAPIFGDFMGRALEGQPAQPFRIPPGVRMVRIDADTGTLPSPGSRVILEAFKPGTEPDTTYVAERETVVDPQFVEAEPGRTFAVGVDGGAAGADGQQGTVPAAATPNLGTGGLY